MLDNIKINGFKCFDNEELDLAPLTLLSGLNSSGKSSFLQALRILHNNGCPLEGHGPLTELVSPSYDGFYLCAYKGDESFGVDFEKGKIELDDDNSKIFPDLFSFISASRFGPRPSLPLSLDSDLLTVGEQGEFVLDLFERNYELSGVPKLLRKAGPLTRSMRQNVTAWLGVISPGVTFDTQIDRKADMGRAEFNDLRAANVGFGLSYTLPIIVNVLIYAALARKKDTSAMILIENPEAHLHPSGQTQLGEFLARAAASGVQIVVETHSDHLLNGIRLAVKEGFLSSENTAFHYFSYDFDEDFTEVEQPVIDKFGMFNYWPDGFFDENEKSLGKLV